MVSTSEKLSTITFTVRSPRTTAACWTVARLPQAGRLRQVRRSNVSGRQSRLGGKCRCAPIESCPEILVEALNDDPLPYSRVLIVDDNQQNLELLAAYMEELPNVTT